FFFQAEDGIRDFHVTGVQTCALPIFGAKEIHPRSNRRSTVGVSNSPLCPSVRSEPVAQRDQGLMWLARRNRRSRTPERRHSFSTPIRRRRKSPCFVRTSVSCMAVVESMPSCVELSAIAKFEEKSTTGGSLHTSAFRGSLAVSGMPASS